MTFTDYTLPELEEWCRVHDTPAYRARQLWQAVYQRYGDDVEAMHVLPRAFRDALSAELPLVSSEVADVHTSRDKTEKYVLRLHDGNCIETVWIPMGSHATVCVSSQVGCPVRCRFCASGADGLVRNLSAGEIVEQVWHALKNHPGSESVNVVFMGIGEPLYNYANLIRAIAILNHHDGLNIGARRITVSTVGYIDGIRDLTRDAPQSNLAISLHATTDQERRRLIGHCPSEIDPLLAELARYYEATHRLITYEYILFDGINDSRADAERLAGIARKVPSKVNLIPYNYIPSGTYVASPPERIEQFAGWLQARGITALIRHSKGDDISGACGQLRRQKQKP